MSTTPEIKKDAVNTNTPAARVDQPVKADAAKVAAQPDGNTAAPSAKTAEPPKSNR